MASGQSEETAAVGVSAMVDQPGFEPANCGVGPSPGSSEGLAKGKAFLGLFLKAERRIFAYIFTLLPNRVDAEDVLQEVSKLMWEKFDEAHPPEDFVAWGCRIAFYKVMEYRRSQRRGRVIFSDVMLERVVEATSEHAGALRLDERLDALACCLGKLGRGDRQLLDERFQPGATVHSVAERLGRSADGVYKSLARLRRALHDCVERTIAAEGRA
jgi:RNA polymerase sigma-70 factor (ECF subfamily)